MSASQLTSAEATMRDRAWEELPALEIADYATAALAWALENTGFDSAETDTPPAAYWRARALFYLGILSLRATRAAMTLIASGYEPETHTFKRTLTDAHSRARHVVEDASGEYARRWLQGRAGKPAAAVGKWAPKELWEMLSHSSHADHRAVENFLAVSEADGRTRFIAAPERRPEVASETLAVFASETRDLAHLLAREHDLAVPELKNLDRLISAHSPWAGEPPDADDAVDGEAAEGEAPS